MFPYFRFLNKSLALPHFLVSDISKINPEMLKKLGFKGLVFDKDNTLTAPYKNSIYPTITQFFEHYKNIFDDKIVIMSNSAGTKDDKNYEDAQKIEEALGIKVLIHNRKKPSGIDAVKNYFGCNPQELVMFGDRVFTDIVFGNRYSMLTIMTALLTPEGDNQTAAKIRQYEIPLIKKWISKGVKPPKHPKYDSSICLEQLI